MRSSQRAQPGEKRQTTDRASILELLRGWGPWPAAALLAVATVLLYSRVWGHSFLYFDDDQYVTRNPWVARGLTWEGVRWAFTTFHFANWHPLTWLSHMLDVQLFGTSPGAHHLVNVALHAANAGLLLAVLWRMTGAAGRSAFVAALFAFHPLHVESVAWVAERKDLLSTFFGFLMLLAYAGHARRPRALGLARTSACLLLSLLSKPMWVTAPFLLLLLDGWPLCRAEVGSVDAGVESGRFRRLPLWKLAAEKVPLLFLSLCSSLVTLRAQARGGALQTLEALGFGERVANSAAAYAGYVAKTLWPTSLSPFYERAPQGVPLWQSAGLGAVLTIVTVWAALRRKKEPWLAVGWLWFLGMLVPVIGLVQVGDQAMADRYTYVPLVGLFLCVAWGGWRLAEGLPEAARRTLPALALSAVVFLGALTWRQVGFWRDQETLFRHAVAVEPGGGRAHLILAQALAEKGDLAEALAQSAEAVRLTPGNPRAYKNLGFLLYRLGRVDEAIAAFRRAIALQPDYAEAHGNLGVAYGKKGWVDAAAREMALEAKLTAGAGAR